VLAAARHGDIGIVDMLHERRRQMARFGKD
jgi:hypothetical protein